jgi:hypothetical protein
VVGMEKIDVIKRLKEILDFSEDMAIECEEHYNDDSKNPWKQDVITLKEAIRLLEEDLSCY